MGPLRWNRRSRLVARSSALTVQIWDWSVVQPDGSLYGEGQGVLMTTDGGMATWRGQGVGRLTGRGSAVNYRGAVYYQTASQQLVRLNGLAVVYEFNVDKNGNIQAQLWEWK